MVTIYSTVTVYYSIHYIRLLYIVQCPILVLSPIASPSDSLAEVLAFIRIRDQPYLSRSHRVANLNLLAKVSEFDWLYYGCVAMMFIL